MKRIIIAVIATICSLTAIGQASNAKLKAQYYLPPSFQTCNKLDFAINDSIIITSNAVGDMTNGGIFSNDCRGLAQPYSTDTTLHIIGISIAFTACNINPTTIYKVQLLDSNFNLLAEKPLVDTLIPGPLGINGAYKEFVFDSTIDVIHNFYVALTFSALSAYMHVLVPFNFMTDVLNPNGTTNYTIFNCNSGTTPQVKLTNGTWVPIKQSLPAATIANSFLFRSMFTDTVTCNTDLYMFPILAVNNSSINDNVELEKSIQLYPNPASKEINITSSYKIEEIEIYNTIGLKVYFKDVSSKEIKIDVSTFARGNYIVKLFTDKGLTTKKFVIN